jgi:MYXO-CTERM domain-containing protein
VTLEFTVANTSATDSATDIAFTDDLGAALEGLEALGLPISDVCGAGSMLSGTDVITLTGGTIAPESSCTFSLEVQVPSDVTSGTTVSNVTSELSGLINGSARTAPPARDELDVTLMTLSKVFEDAVEVGSSTTLTFVIENLNGDSTATGVGFTDDLDAVLEGLAATGTPIEDACGPGSVLDGSPVVSLRGGSIDAGGSCTFGVTVAVPSGAAPGEYQNVTSELSSDLGVAGDPATARLTVVPAMIPDGGVDAGPDAGPDGGTGDGLDGGGCGCRTTGVKDTPTWLLAFVLFVAWRRTLRT